MKLSYKGKLFEVTSKENELVIDGKPYPMVLDKYNNNILKISLGDEQKVVYVASDERNAYVFIDGEQYVLQRVEESYGIEEEVNGSDKSIEQIKPPMPGSIVKLLVEKGQEVEEGSPIVVVEAMKMEITLYSSISGVVSEINVEPGQQVDSDKVLVVIKRNEID
jgi:3-methylcrotonyl-CoA carboxylase alpha subunit